MYKNYQEMNGECLGKLFCDDSDLGQIAAENAQFYARGLDDFVAGNKDTTAAIGYMAYWRAQDSHESLATPENNF